MGVHVAHGRHVIVHLHIGQLLLQLQSTHLLLGLLRLCLLLLLPLLLLLSLHVLNLDVPNDLRQLVELRDIHCLVPILGLELLPALEVMLDFLTCGLSIHD